MNRIQQMIRDEMGVLAALVVVAEERSFTRAQKRLRVSPSAVSHAIRDVEEKIGVRLLARTTRSLVPTEAGERLLARLGPALGNIRDALDEISRLGDRAGGYDYWSRVSQRCLSLRRSWGSSRRITRMSCSR